MKTSRNFTKCEKPNCDGEYRVSLPDELAGACVVHCNKCYDRKPEFYEKISDEEWKEMTEDFKKEG